MPLVPFPSSRTCGSRAHRPRASPAFPPWIRAGPQEARSCWHAKTTSESTRVGPGTPMGTTMRRYWIPALLAWELPEPDCPPVRVRLLGEDLVAFRDTPGQDRPARRALPAPPRVALLRPQRGVRPALRLPRLEVRRRRPLRGHDERARGAAASRDKIRTTAYPTVEVGGVVWAYLGPAERRPPLPNFAWTQAPATHRHVSKVIQECNWLQGLEGGIDTSHAPILHRVLSADSTRPGFKPGDPFVRGKAPMLEVDVTDYGYRYAGLRPARRRQRARAGLSLHPAVPPDPSRSHRRAATTAAWPVTSGCRWMTRPPWSTTGSTARTEPLDRRGPPRAPPRQRSASTSTRRPSARERNRENNYLLDRQRAEDRDASPGSTASTSRTARSRRAWARSSTAAASISGRPTAPSSRRAGCSCRRSRRSRPAARRRGVEPTYYTLRPAEAVLPRDADWRTLLTPEAPGGGAAAMKGPICALAPRQPAQRTASTPRRLPSGAASQLDPSHRSSGSPKAPR